MLIYSNKRELINCNYKSAERHHRLWLADAWLEDRMAAKHECECVSVSVFDCLRGGFGGGGGVGSPLKRKFLLISAKRSARTFRLASISARHPFSAAFACWVRHSSKFRTTNHISFLKKKAFFSSDHAGSPLIAALRGTDALGVSGATLISLRDIKSAVNRFFSRLEMKTTHTACGMALLKTA